MLPLGVNPVTQIEQEKNPATQVIQLVSLLEYLLGFVNSGQTGPGLIGKEGQPASVGELANVNRALFSNPPDVFFGIGVRNNIVHAKATDATEAEIRRAVSHLFKAVNDLRAQANIPANIKQEVFTVSLEQAPTQVMQGPTKPVTTSSLSPAPPAPNFRPIGQTAPTSSTPIQPTAPVTTPATSPTSYTTKVSPKQTPPEQKTMTAEPSITTRQIRNAALVLGILAAALFAAKPLWQFGKERLYGSEANTQITRAQAEASLKRIQTFDKRQGFAAKVTEAQAAWRDAEIAFKQEKFKDAESGYRRVLQMWDELAVKENERKEVQQFFDEMNKVREAARVAQAPQYAAAFWQEAETTRRAADAAFRTGDLAAARQTALQAQQKFEEAKSAAEAAPKPIPSPTPAPANDPPPSDDSGRARPRPESLL